MKTKSHGNKNVIDFLLYFLFNDFPGDFTKNYFLVDNVRIAIYYRYISINTECTILTAISPLFLVQLFSNANKKFVTSLFGRSSNKKKQKGDFFSVRVSVCYFTCIIWACKNTTKKSIKGSGKKGTVI